MSARTAFVLVVSFIAACGDGGSNAGPSDASSGGGTGSSTQSVPSNPSTTGEVASTSSASEEPQDGTVSGSATSTGELPTSAGSESSESGEGSEGAASTGSTGDDTAGSDTGAGLGPYADCSGQALPCPEGSFCLLFPGSGVCTQEGCRDAADCPEPPPGGTAPVTCLDANGDDLDDCRIDCSGGEICPTGMECFSGEICIWS